MSVLRCQRHRSNALLAGWKSNGFSLIEVMIVIAIIAALVAFTVPMGQAYIANNRVRSATESFRSVLSIARAEATKRNRPVNLRMDLAASQWRVETIENVLGLGTITTVIRSGDYAETGTVTGPYQADLTIVFDAFGRATGAGPNFDFGSTVGTCQSGGGEIRCLRVILAAAGQATLCDTGLVYANDPRGCRP
jgi:type IV fimbrial biogenesis protein FimT